MPNDAERALSSIWEGIVRVAHATLDKDKNGVTIAMASVEVALDELVAATRAECEAAQGALIEQMATALTPFEWSCRESSAALDAYRKHKDQHHAE